jgi:hypothetical protein
MLRPEGSGKEISISRLQIFEAGREDATSADILRVGVLAGVLQLPDHATVMSPIA